MQYTKPMIDHVFMIRKIVPDTLRTQIKLANPNLLDVMADVYREIQDALLRDLIRQLMSMAGPSWLSLLEDHIREPSANHSQQVYRGHALPQEQVDDTKPQKIRAATREKTVIYRGQTLQVAS
jgi:hypothetical protein